MWVIDPTAPGTDRGCGWVRAPAAGHCDLPRHLHLRGLDVQARGAEDRRAALSRRLDLRGSRALRGLPVAALLFVLAVILFAPATLGGKVLSASDIPLFKPPFEPQPPGARPENPLQFDAAYVFEPDGLAVREALRDGRLPVWSPELEAGWPLLATQQSAAAVSAHLDRGRVPLLGVARLDRGDQAHPGRTRNVPVRPRSGTSARLRPCSQRWRSGSAPT